ncbi:cytochrome c oxidase subunit 8 [Lycorma delicatula]|uniref:cytochrome c oxidase subunit 8 n=1 Tax=Lycorma delicatula TaxID=130591 RepID=UPI003F5196EE
MLNGALIKSVNLAGRNVLCAQRRNIVYSPPLRRMPFAQKLIIGSAMVLSGYIVPAYILVNLKYYNKSAVEE